MNEAVPAPLAPRVTDVAFGDEDAVRLRAAARIEANGAVGYDSDHAPVLSVDIVRAHLLVRDADGLAAGVGALVDAPDGVMEIRGLYVRREVRDARIAGNALLDALESRAAQLGAPAVVWECPPQLATPIERMTARGYARIANWGPYEPFSDTFCFAKVLD
jgi:putative acetyltransferase